MKKLRAEIYNTLVGKQSIEAFEAFLYGNENILSNLESNAFYHTIVTMNYRLENSLAALEYEASVHYGSDFIKVLVIERCCMEILSTTDQKRYYTILDKMIIEFDYYDSPSSSIFWNFYGYYEALGTEYINPEIKEGIYPEVKNFAQGILEKLEACTSFSAKKELIFKKPETVLVKEVKSEERQKSIIYRL